MAMEYFDVPSDLGLQRIVVPLQLVVRPLRSSGTGVQPELTVYLRFSGPSHPLHTLQANAHLLEEHDESNETVIDGEVVALDGLL